MAGQHTHCGVVKSLQCIDFLQYLDEDVSCSIEYITSKNEAELLEWLVQLAISYVYEDLQESPELTGNPL